MTKLECTHEQEHEVAVQKAKENTLPLSDVEEVCQIFRLLSEPSRLKIVLALMQGDMCVYHLLEICDSTKSALSHQLRILKDNNIVKARRFGKNIEYSIADMHVREIVEKGVAHLHCEKEN